MRKFITAVFVLVVLFSSQAISQDTQNETQSPPCSAPEFSQFDFWVGQWDLTWSDTAHGTNTITKDYDGCVIREDFDSAPSGLFKGMSVSTFNKNLGLWQQTWVDNQGAYLDFKGGWEEDKMVLSRSFIKKDSTTVYQRMVWYNITDDSFDWNWQGSKDGENWNTLWHIEYKRRQ